MTNQQLAQIKAFSKPFYRKTGKFHGWDHIKEVAKHALHLSKEYPQTNLNVLLSACFLHDIGRSIKDKNHARESTRIATPFLLKIKVDQQDIDAITHAILCHEYKEITSAKTIEARILFDADKLEILSVHGFLRTAFWLVEERNMEFSHAVNFLWSYSKKTFENYLFSQRAKDIVSPEMDVLTQLVNRFNTWSKRV